MCYPSGCGPLALFVMTFDNVKHVRYACCCSACNSFHFSVCGLTLNLFYCRFFPFVCDDRITLGGCFGLCRRAKLCDDCLH